MKIIDLRSDTQTQPTEQMRKAMYAAEVGDDVAGEDKSMNALEEKAARLIGKESAMFVTSGTQGNLVAILSHCSKADEILVGSESHIFWNENAAVSSLVGAQTRMVNNETDGTLNIEHLATSFRPSSGPQFPYTTLVCLENTHNRCNGAAISPEHTSAVAKITHDNGAALHIDGARIFNAAIALETDASYIVRDADSVTFCLSKGLSGPVGSLLCGSKEFIETARKWRRMLGAGRRQAGSLAAAGIVALDEMIDRLSIDHDNAKILANNISNIPGITIDAANIQTNIVIFEVDNKLTNTAIVVNRLKEKGVLVSTYFGVISGGGSFIRMVTHRHINRNDIDEASKILRSVMADLRQT